MNKVNLSYVLTILALSVLPYTSLRFGAIGIGEAVILSVFLITLIHYRDNYSINKTLRPIVLFWLTFLGVCLVSAFFNKLYYIIPSGTLLSLVYDLSAYIFVLIMVLNISLILTKHEFSFEGIRFVHSIILIWSYTFSLLYLASYFSDSMFGLPLRTHGAFTPLVENVHQASSIMCVMPFINLYFFSQVSFRLVRFTHLAFAVLFVFMALDSNSTKAMLGLVFGFVAMVFGFMTSNEKRDKTSRAFRMCLLIAFMALLFAFTFSNWEFIGKAAIGFFTENDASSARESLYSIGFQKVLDSPVLGYGPGAHVPLFGHYMDAHNTSLTVLLQGGLIGFLVFLIFVYRLFNKVKSSPYLLAGASSLFIYILGGDILRRLPIWFLICAMYILAESIDNRTIKKSGR